MEDAMRWMLVFILVSFVASRASGLQVGDPAPDVSAPSTSGETLKLSSLTGSWVVVYFYPKAFTPGCTAESCALRDGYAAIEKLGAVILGVSLDSLETQKRFKAEHNMPFELLSDSQKDVAKAFDSLGLGGLVASRKTFIINPAGKIAYIFDKVSTATHNQEVLEVLKKLQGEKPVAGE